MRRDGSSVERNHEVSFMEGELDVDFWVLVHICDVPEYHLGEKP